MPRHFVSFRVPNSRPSAVCEQYVKTKEGIFLALEPNKEQKLKKLNFLREVQPGLIIEQFSHLYLISSFNEAEFFVPEISEYERLKATLAYGLKAGKFGISAATALRIFIYYLLSNNRFKDAVKLLKLCSEEFDFKKLCERISDPIDLLAIAMDKEQNYLQNPQNCEHYSSLIKLLLLKEKKQNLILEFANFFKIHKKASSAQGALELLKKVKDV